MWSVKGVVRHCGKCQELDQYHFQISAYGGGARRWLVKLSIKTGRRKQWVWLCQKFPTPLKILTGTANKKILWLTLYKKKAKLPKVMISFHFCTVQSGISPVSIRAAAGGRPHVGVSVPLNYSTEFDFQVDCVTQSCDQVAPPSAQWWMRNQEQ